MTHSPQEVLRLLLINLGLGSEIGSGFPWPVYVYSKPDKPDNVIVVGQTAAMLDGRNMRDGYQVEHPGAQILIRALDDVAANNKGRAIENALAEQVNNTVVEIDATINSPSAEYIVYAFKKSTGLTFMGQEELNRRRMYVVNGFLSIVEV